MRVVTLKILVPTALHEVIKPYLQGPFGCICQPKLLLSRLLDHRYLQQELPLDVLRRSPDENSEARTDV